MRDFCLSRGLGEVYEGQVKSRAATLDADVGRNLGTVLRSKLGQALKAQYDKAYVLSKALYNAGTWPRLGLSLIHT